MPNENTPFFSTPLLNGMLAQVVQLVRFGDGLPIICGEAGLGKSTVALEAASRLAADGVVVCVNCNDYASDFTAFLLYVLEHLGCANEEVTSAGEGLSHLRNFSRILLKNERLGALVLDDADALDDMSLAALLSLVQGQGGNGAGLHFIFTGKSSLVERIDKLDIVDVGVYDFELSSFSPIEAQDFIAFVSSQRGIALSKESAASLWSASKGNPEKILNLINSTPSDVVSTPVHKPRLKIIQALKALPILHVITVCVLIFVLLLVVIFSGDKPTNKNVSVEIIDLPETLKPVVDSVSDSTAVNTKLVVSGQSSTQEVLSDLNAVIPSNILEADRKNERELNETLSGKLPSDAKKDVNTQLISQEQPAKPLQNEPPKLTPDAAPEIISKAKNDESPEINRAIKSNRSSVLDDLLTKSKRLVLRQPKDAFTLQVIALGNPDALMQYISRQPNKNALHVIKAKRPNGTLYLVVTGVFKTKLAAQDAVSDLPLVQRQAKPWPKTYESIQNEIR